MQTGTFLPRSRSLWLPSEQQCIAYGSMSIFCSKKQVAAGSFVKLPFLCVSLTPEITVKGTFRKNVPSTESYVLDRNLGIVITGGTSGLGYALTREFLSSKDNVVICGRDKHRLTAAVSALEEEFEGSSIHGIVCDVANPSDVRALGAFAAENLGVIHRWVNNAGEVTGKRILADVEASEIIRVSGTNLIGSLLCCREAVRIMREQASSKVPTYHIFNMGFTQWGAKFTKSACTHKATKIALTQLTASLSEELQAADISSIGVHNLSPGLVLTDLLLKDSTPIARRFFNTLAEEPSTAAAYLAPRIRRVHGAQQRIELLSPASAFWKVLVGFPQIFAGGRFFDKDGNRVVMTGKKYKENGVEIVY